jgi:ABC-2 type transport system permease protein
MQLIILGYAANLDVRDISTIVCDMDNTQASREFVENFTHSGYFTLNGYVDNINQIDKYIDHDEADLAIVIPNDFESDLLANASPQLQIIADGSNANTAGISLNYASMIVYNYSQNIIAEKFVDSNPVDAEMRVWYNPALRSRNFMVPGVLAMILMVLTMILTSLALVKEKEVGTMEQLIVTPIKPHQLIIGKLVPFTLIGMIIVVLVITVTVFGFGIAIKGNLFLLLGLCLVFLMTTLGLGLFISTVSSNQQQAMMTSVFFVMLPMIYLSGFVFPIENMPKIIQLITYLIPLRYFFVIIRGLFLKGVGVAELWDQALILFILGFGILALSVSRFQKKLG